MPETISIETAQRRFEAQGVSSNRQYAVKCPVCGTVQSMETLVYAGVKKDEVHRYFGFSCEGRFTNAGPWPGAYDKSKKAVARRAVRGCDWTLGGLFKIHKLEITQPDDSIEPSFEIASPEEAQALAKIVAVNPERGEAA